MYYFYYFQDTKTSLYYGGFTNNILNRQYKHQEQVNKNLKSDKKPWHLYQDKIKPIILWAFNTKKEACVYEKQWIINNYLNPICLNCSVSNSEYDASTDRHKQLCLKNLTKEERQKICEEGGGCKAKILYALEVNNTTTLYTFQSSYEAKKFTKVTRANIYKSRKTAKPYNSELGRWLFSNVSIDDLKNKLNSLSYNKIKGYKNKNFLLVNKITGQQSQVFNSVTEPLKYGYKIIPTNLSQCLLGNLRTVNGYYVILPL